MTQSEYDATVDDLSRLPWASDSKRNAEAIVSLMENRVRNAVLSERSRCERLVQGLMELMGGSWPEGEVLLKLIRKSE